jgi:hypothetical protein
MFILDAIGRFLEFVQSLLFAGFLPQDNNEASVYNIFLVILRLIGLAGF